MKKCMLCVLIVCAILLSGLTACAEASWENILLLGNDTRSFPEFERSDVMVIVSINEADCKVKLTSIMRDTDVSYAGGGSGKINGAMAIGGPQKAVDTVSEAFGVDISGYVVIDFQQLAQAVDLIGGVDIELTDREIEYIDVEQLERFQYNPDTPPIASAGMAHLAGWQSVSYARDRSSSPAADYDRVKRQRRMLIALLNELQEKPVDEAFDLADDLMTLISTDLADERLMELGKIALAVDTSDIDEFRLPADGTFQDGTFNGVWKIKPNLEKNRRLLQEFIHGAELKKGSSGENVRRLQQKLIEMDLLNDKADGIYGSKTEAAVSEAQAQLGFEQTGIASEEFLEMLYAQ